MNREQYLENLILRALDALAGEGCEYHRMEKAEDILRKFDEWEPEEIKKCQFPQ